MERVPVTSNRPRTVDSRFRPSFTITRTLKIWNHSDLNMSIFFRLRPHLSITPFTLNFYLFIYSFWSQFPLPDLIMPNDLSLLVRKRPSTGYPSVVQIGRPLFQADEWQGQTCTLTYVSMSSFYFHIKPLSSSASLSWLFIVGPCSNSVFLF